MGCRSLSPGTQGKPQQVTGGDVHGMAEGWNVIFSVQDMECPDTAGTERGPVRKTMGLYM